MNVPAASKLPEEDMKKPNTREIEVPSPATAQVAFGQQPPAPPQQQLSPPGYPPVGQFDGVPQMMQMPPMGYPGQFGNGYGMPAGGMPPMHPGMMFHGQAFGTA
eukprot:3219300-Rhodomonas_salina.2